ncbi:putative chromate transport protein [Ruegeria denitrificans]|uniref:Putative chromate transport protein n=1 Tax=Ruegeria denitrificans TaxID=1715692 RepID=A0A0P1IFA5_9RHOB|nr:chromate efflux transporter [Ruegeria denitrificans]CUJ96182.1 putative chromate transport protein [Ruegeria denitrificans]
MTPTNAELVRVFGRIGLLSFGGPAAQISLMHQELVDRRPWLDEQAYLRALSLCMLLPGPEAMQLATYAGWRLRGVTGGLIAGSLFVLPGAFVIAVLVGFYAAFGNLPLVQAGFLGVKATVIVIVLQALRNLSRKALTDTQHRAIAGLGFFAIFALNLTFPLIILAAAIWGYATFTGEAKTADVPPAPKVNGMFRTAAIWLVLWLGPLLALTLSGLKLLSDLGWFFARLAVVTFGGAYAVLAYMTQTVVDKYQWVSTDQMIDALGLAETTPGPLILVTQFVAMLTGQISGGAPLAIAAGAVALWATFVPCFLWIFLAAPYLDQLATRPRLSAALHGITAAVVGVILNLSVWFSLNVLFHNIPQQSWGPLSIPWPDPTSLNPTALILTLVAAVLIFKLKFGMATTLAIMAVIGTGIHFL